MSYEHPFEILSSCTFGCDESDNDGLDEKPTVSSRRSPSIFAVHDQEIDLIDDVEFRVVGKEFAVDRLLEVPEFPLVGHAVRRAAPY